MSEMPAIPRVGGMTQLTQDQNTPIDDDEGKPPIDQYLDMNSGDSEVTENADGSAEVVINDPTIKPQTNEFLSNLADVIEDGARHTLGLEYIELLERDRDSRKLRDKQYEEGIKRSGLGKDAPGGADFDGASRVVHPVIAESCVDFCARSIKETFPPNGPVRLHITGQQTQPKLDKATRKCDFLNWQLTEEIKEYRPQVEQIYTQLPLGGSQYHKFWWDESMRRPRSEFIPIDDILLPYAASDFYSSHRVTHVQHIIRAEFEKRIISGLYRDVSVVDPSFTEKTASAIASEKVEGKDESGYNEDGLRDIFEISTDLSIEEDHLTGGDPAPYILVIDEFTMEVLAIYRNWEEGDELRQKLVWIVEYSFIPWRGAQGIGLPHLIGGLSAALTGGLRALLDSAHINNSATALKLKGARFGGTSESISITQVTEVEATGVDDIRKVAMPLPFNPPSEMLFKLIGYLDAKAGGVVATSEEKIADATNSGPVGTTQALIEQGAVVYASIHSRLHFSQKRALEVICRLNKRHLDEDLAYKRSGLTIKRSDFGLPGDVIPVSDPNIFSETQRFAQSQSIIAMSDKAPQFYDLREVHYSILKQMRIPNLDSLMPPPKKPKELNPIAENVALVMGQSIAVFPDQDHLAHIQVLLDFLQSPVFGMNPIITPKFMNGALEHLKQHMVFWYAKHAHELTTRAIGKDITEYMKEKPLFEEVDRLLATASKVIIKDAGAAFQGVMPIIQGVIQMMQQQAQQAQQNQPLDPASKAALQASEAETARKSTKDKADATLKAAHIQQQTTQHQESDQTRERIAAAQIGHNAKELLVDLAKHNQELEQQQRDQQQQQQDQQNQQQHEVQQNQQQNQNQQNQSQQEHEQALQQAAQQHAHATQQQNQQHGHAIEQTVATAAVQPPEQSQPSQSGE